MAGSPAVVALTGNGWQEALEQSGFWGLFRRTPDEPCRVLVLVDLSGARVGDPERLAPAAVEGLIDLIHAQAPGASVDLATSADETQLWAGNRDIYALAELLGYRFVTDGGHDYDIVDLGENVRDAGFAEGSVLHDTGLSADWLDADVRLNLARLRCDPAEGFAGGLVNLLTCLPLADKPLHYRHRRDLGEVISALLACCPPDHTLVEIATDEPEVAGGAAFASASRSPLLADYAAAVKAGLDPFASDLLAAVARDRPIPAGFRIAGAFAPAAALAPSPPLPQASARARRNSEAGDRLATGWLRRLDPDLFPASRPLDAKAGEIAAALAGSGKSPSGNALITALNLALGAGGKLAEAWRTLADKDALVRRAVSLGFDPHAVPAARYDAVAEELEALLPIAAAAPERGDGLRWRKFEKGVLFEYRRRAAIPFETFVAKVDVARTIAHMNDYLGGVLVVVERDDAGRPIRQAERNLYLPQPNYLVLYGGQPIDVTKLETVRYEADAHRLYWKTIHSSNGSATADDGVAFFERDGAGTRVTIAGKQRFTLPPLLQIFDPALLPEVEAALTSEAYQRFFDRTYANFEALVEGREILLGKAPDAETAHPSIALEQQLRTLAERAAPWLERVQGVPRPRPERDGRGFVHVGPTS
ncbi:MAG: DUF362 domain-containing protein [Novosphingobium sp.]